MTFRIPVIRYLIAALFSLVAAVSSTKAADELLVYVFSEGKPVAGADVLIDENFAGQTAADGSLLTDIEGDGGHILAIKTDTTQAGTRFTANAGQLVDVIAQLDTDEVYVDVYSQTESIADQRSAPQGSLAIRVTQAGQPVAQEPVYIAGYSGSLQTDSSGDASVTLKRGRYRVQVAEKTAYLRVVGGLDRSVVVAISESAETMEIAAPTMEEVFVTATFDPSGLEVSERDTANIVDTIGVELLARFSDSDVAASVVRVPGISVQDDKYVFIRGLGGRYVSSTLNNATMPSTNPSKRTVPLDLFPSNFVNQLDIKKTFLPYMPGESTGGNLVINTKTFPDDRVLGVSIQGGYTADLTGETVFVDPLSGDFDVLGWDDGTRAEDPALALISDFLRTGEAVDSQTGEVFPLDDYTEGELRRVGALLIQDGFDPDFKSAAPDAKFGFTAGNLFLLDNSELGVYAAANYSNEWSKQDDGERYTYESQGEVADNFLYRQYTNTIEANGLVSVGWNIGNNTFEWNTVASRVTASQLERSVGQEGDEFQSLLRQTIQWEERQYLSTQLLGSHFLNEDGSFFLEWQGTISQAERYAPDRREYDFSATSSATDPAGLKAQYDFQQANDQQAALFKGFILEPGTIIRRYDDLVDDNIDVSADLTWDVFDAGASFGQLKTGFQLIYRERESKSSTYGFNVNQVRDDLLRTNNLLVSDVIYSCESGSEKPGCLPGGEGGISSSPNTGLAFVDKTLASDSYDAELEYNSAYLMYDHTFAAGWQVLIGGRYETYEQTTDTFSLQGTQGAVQSVIDEDSFLPSLGVNWFVSDSHQLRLGLSQTVARPDFKEAANATFYDNEFNFRVRGNPFLEISDIINADLRWEWYLSEIDSLSIALFYKDMDKPIERVVQAASGTAGNSRTFQNAESAELYGIEVDGRFEFMLGDGYDQTLFVSFNAALIESEVTANNQDARALQGQPEYTANLIFGYDNISAGHQLTILLNQNGRSIADVGVSGQPDVFLEPRLDLNIVYRFDISESVTLKAKLENLLDDEVEYSQGGQVFQIYNRGASVQLGVDWLF
ncbi:MAG: TonB-dependent receptor [Luminiphilus sp.]|nr:TonB-dependent receptor [Luminiphilus sp.]